MAELVFGSDQEDVSTFERSEDLDIHTAHGSSSSKSYYHTARSTKKLLNNDLSLTFFCTNGFLLANEARFDTHSVLVKTSSLVGGDDL